MQDFKRLRVWQEAYSLSLSIYRITKPVESLDKGLIWQARRSALSVSYNIAEGSGRGSKLDQARFFQIARGSASELECQLMLLRDLDYIDRRVIKDQLSSLFSIQKMLTKLIAFKKK